MPAETFRPLFNRALSIIAWCVVATALVAMAVTPAAFERPLLAVGFAAIASLAWVCLWSPSVRIDDDGVTIENIATIARIPWNAIIDVDTRFALTIVVPGRRYRATAAPAPGQLAGLRRGVRASDAPTSDSGQAAELVRRRWDSVRDRGLLELGTAQSTPVAVSARVPQLAVLGATVLALVLAALLPVA